MSRGLPGSRIAWAFGALLLLALASLPLFFERVEEQEDFGPTGLARINPYHGLERVLGELGVPAESRFGLGPLPATDHVLVVLATEVGARRLMWPRLVPWVEGGGHLVIVAAAPTGGADTGEEEVLAEEPDVLDELDLFAVEAEGLTTRVSGPAGVERELAEAPRRVLAAYRDLEAGWWWTQDQLWAARLVLGEGRITVLGDAAPFDNDALAEADHAPLAWDLLRRDQGVPAGAVLVLSGDRPGLLTLAWRHAGPLVVAALVLVGLVAWRGAVRIAPVEPDPVPVRRDLMEHVAASGTFLWRHDQHEALLAPARQAVLRRLGLSGPDPAAAFAAAVEQGPATDLLGPDLDPDAVRAALFGPVPATPGALLSAVRTLQQLWSQR